MLGQAEARLVLVHTRQVTALTRVLLFDGGELFAIGVAHGRGLAVRLALFVGVSRHSIVVDSTAR